MSAADDNLHSGGSIDQKQSRRPSIDDLRLYVMEKLRGGVMKSSQSSICMESKQRKEMFINKGKCAHNMTYCIDGISKHVKAKVQGNITFSTCLEPDYNAKLQHDICQLGVIDREIFKGHCLEMFVKDKHGEGGSSKTIDKLSKRAGEFRGLNISFQSICRICMQGKQLQEMFINKRNPCSHIFCIECISKHVAAKVERNITVITCPEPDCKATLEPEICQGIIAKKVFEMWSTALFKSFCSRSKTVNCPFKDCTLEMLVEDDHREGGLLITKTECPYCHRLFCAQCKVSWHLDMGCEDFRRMKKEGDEKRQALDDQMFVRLAEKNKWRKCPNCKFYVQKSEGCSHIICRCKFEFCYGCGSKWSLTHRGCQG